MGPSENENQNLEMNAACALFEGSVQSLVALCYENERPLQGLAGALDWYFQGEISGFLRQKVISGRVGEMVYLPIQKNRIYYRILLAGAGINLEPGQRGPVKEDSLITLNRTLRSIKIGRIGVSKSDFGNSSIKTIQRCFEGVSYCIFQ